MSVILRENGSKFVVIGEEDTANVRKTSGERNTSVPSFKNHRRRKTPTLQPPPPSARAPLPDHFFENRLPAAAPAECRPRTHS